MVCYLRKNNAMIYECNLKDNKIFECYDTVFGIAITVKKMRISKTLIIHLAKCGKMLIKVTFIVLNLLNKLKNNDIVS